jgi:hypothetical protein
MVLGEKITRADLADMLVQMSTRLEKRDRLLRSVYDPGIELLRIEALYEFPINPTAA